jgi:long-chain acyl-CoA synthetase
VVVVAPAAPLPARQPGAPEVHALREVVAEGLARVAGDASLARQHEAQARRLSADDIATIIYTSGTTGHPKGVVLTHRNILSNMMAVNAVVQIRGDDEPLSFLPLSHVFERLALYLFLLLGCRVSFAESLQTVSRDLVRARPTIMTGVPRVFEKFHQASAGGNKPRGTGLGLPICKQIIEYFDGRIWAEVAPGGGARLVFELPLGQRAPGGKAESK